MNIDLTGKKVLVTGATGGIGLAVTRVLAHAGATVAVHYNCNAERAKALVKEIGNDSCAFKADLNIPEECFRLFVDVLARYESIDTLVNNAGIIIKSALDTPAEQWLEDWNSTMTINLTSAAILCRAAVNHFLSTDGGRIITISSRSAFRGDDADSLAYAAAKGGLVAMSRSIARAYGRDNILSFIVAPGFVKTGVPRQFAGERDEDMVSSDIALNHLTEPEDIAPTILFLASGLMDHATGCTIDINAGSYVH